MPLTTPIEILHVFRAYQIPAPADGSLGPRGTLTVCRAEGGVAVYFDYADQHSKLKRDLSTHPHAFFLDKDANPAELPAAERELGTVRIAVFGEKDDLIYGLGRAFNLYSRLPVPPPGAAMRTAVASVSTRIKASGG